MSLRIVWYRVGGEVPFARAWLIHGMLFNTVSISFQLYHGNQCTYSCFPGVLLTSALHNILSKHFLLFPVFSTCSNNFLPFSSSLKFSSANSFNLEESKIFRILMG